jgi:hypothetical protein
VRKARSHSMHKLIIPFIALAGTLSLGFSSHAIIVRHDVRADSYEVKVVTYPAVFYLEQQGRRRVCAATVIHPRWAISAAHCLEETSLASTVENRRRFAVTVAGKTREIDAAIIHPDFDMTAQSDVDLVLLRFREASSFPVPYPLQQDPDELGATVRLVGWGYFGLGTSGRQFDDGKLRMATNVIEQAGSRLQLKFDDPRRVDDSPLALEGMPSLGDSGGPALIETGSGLVLAGVAVGEIMGSDYSEETQGKYGSVAVYERLSLHIDWIETVIGSRLPFDS